jgi:LAGLIDADG DNA endonuclease family
MLPYNQPNLETKPLSEARSALGADVFDVLLGTLLGDGSLKINKGYKNARFAMRHSIAQEEWFDFKVNILKSLASEKGVHVQKPDGFSKLPKKRFQTLVNVNLTRIHSVISTKGLKEVKRTWLNFLTPKSLMVWWCDDGSLGRGDRGTISTHSFSKKENELIVSYLKTVWGINCSTKKRVDKIYHKTPKTYWIIEIATRTDLLNFLRIILPFLPCESMVYKFLPIFKNVDKQVQQRWISELKKAKPEYSLFIDTYVKKHHPHL